MHFCRPEARQIDSYLYAGDGGHGGHLGPSLTCDWMRLTGATMVGSDVADVGRTMCRINAMSFRARIWPLLSATKLRKAACTHAHMLQHLIWACMPPMTLP